MISPEDLLRHAEQAAAEAKTASDLDAAHRKLKAAIRIKRRQETGGELAQSYAAAMEVWDDQKEQGVPLAERVKGLEQTLRAAWPKGREWKYVCQDCEDYGWIFRTCTPGTPCGRPFRLPGQRPDDYTGRGRCSPGHTYCVACFCPKGRGFAAGLQQGGSRPVDLTRVGKSRGFTKAGR